MSTIHLTNGDVAAETLRIALAQAGRDDRVQPLRDDLAVGPLRGIDDGPHVRAGFWERVSANTQRDFVREFREQAAVLDGLATSRANLVVWHGESASDQLMLRRVCYLLNRRPQRLNAVRLSITDLTDRRASAHTREDRATSVGMFAPDVLRTRLPDAAPISALRISRLALEWQEVTQANGETRRWRDNAFTSGGFAELDALILERTTDDWQPAARVAAHVMTAPLGFLVSDSIVLWRIRELEAQQRIRLRGDTNAWRSLELCAVPAPCSPQ
ncbi:DUF1835 domain-containing protein [Paraburkholderia sp. MMS20-SJTN17]|uniref:DUF1835 domain-containing protein n=1 Tax=Paraburkholderia translucens TaxID=2886945 RepID=A0ABS8KL71_9BURK|nr:DUF1835 domain-containing protein [Paraburkholderia sp. MMS20-SJTN17]MCC8405516.1 DUF1835 domain-containing protein [Paraburkholderia sp. MMS20-SJTN17]